MKVLLIAILVVELQVASGLRALGSSCSSPYPYSQPGCNAVNDTLSEIDKLKGLAGFDDSWLDDALSPMIGAIVKSVIPPKLCFGKFKGKDLLNPSGSDAALGDDKCSMIPVNPDSEYTVLSLTLPKMLMSTVCGDLDPTVQVSMCMVLSTCESHLPTVAFAGNNGLLSCILGNPTMAAATAGISKVLAESVKLTVDSFVYGLSATADLERTMTLYNGQDQVEVIARANFAQTMGLTIGSASVKLPDYIQITSVGYHLLSVVGDPVGLVEKLASNYTDISNTVDAVTDGFSAAYTGQLDFTFQLSKLSKGMLPDIKMKLAEGSTFATAVPSSQTGIDKGVYLFAEAKDFVGAAVEAMLQSLLPMLGQAIDKLFGEGAADQLLKHLQPKAAAKAQLGMTVNEEVAGFFLSIPVEMALKALPPFSLLPPPPSGWAGDLKLHCKAQYSNDKFSCSVDYIKPKFFSILLKKGKWIIREAKEFFDETGDIIAAVAEDIAQDIKDCAIGFFANQGDKCNVFSKKNIQKTAQEIVKAGEALDDTLKEWANKAQHWCGTEMVKDAIKCGTEVVEDAVSCGTRAVTDYTICGYKYVKNGIKCAWDYVWGKKGCKVPNTCHVPNQCKIALECEVPKLC
mmetsp:Transcript_28451/g.45833  ORF Transcript_28451/g.45833 Transcript_28451/m.45833 type:complete len:628 (-) Transcript_28451:3721-5604(-)